MTPHLNSDIVQDVRGIMNIARIIYSPMNTRSRYLLSILKFDKKIIIEKYCLKDNMDNEDRR